MSTYYKEVMAQYKEACDRYPMSHQPMTALQIACAEVDQLRAANAKLEQELKDAREAYQTQQDLANVLINAALKDKNAAESRLAALERDGERLDAITHGWRIGHEVGASGCPDHWYIWTTDWSQPLGEGTSLRAAIDAARQKGQP